MLFKKKNKNIFKIVMFFYYYQKNVFLFKKGKKISIFDETEE